MNDWLRSHSISSSAHPALVWRERIWTYAELNTTVDELADRLAEAGLREGQRAAVLLPNNPNFVTLIHALMRLGVTLVPLNLRLKADELRWQVERSACEWILGDESTFAQAAEIKSPRSQVLDISDLRICEFARINANLSAIRANSRLFADKEFDMDRPLAIIHTSGTTGHPKGAVQTIGNHFYSAIASAFRLGTLPDDRWLLTIPLYHVGGLAIPLRCCLYGTTVVLPSKTNFDAESLLNDIEKYSVTMVSLVPTMLQRMIETIGVRAVGFAESLRLILLGGASAPSGLLEKAHDLNLPVALTYGLTEAASQVTTCAPEQTRAKPGSAGSPLMFTSVRIENEQGQALPPGEIGEIVVSGPTVMCGYDQNPGATDQTLRGGALHTGDLGYLDTDGDLWIVTRRSDLIVTGGENVYPAEVERVLLSHSSVREACVVGVDNIQWGQKVAAAITLKNGKTAASEEIQAFCREKLAGYKIPREIRIVESLPMTASGKIQRGEVKKLFSGDDDG